MINFDFVKERGEYLGFCERKGYIYSVPVHKDFDRHEKYAVVAIKDSEVEVLIYHYVERRDQND